jgi:hypothetical protein
MSGLTVKHSLPPIVADEVCKILVACTHRFRNVRQAALTYAKSIIETFSALMCDRKVVFTLLEILTMMRRSCELQFTDEVRYISDAGVYGGCQLIRQVLASTRVPLGQDGSHLTAHG